MNATRLDDVVSVLRSHLPELARFEVRSIAVFGSVARNEAKPGSDLDVLVEFSRPTFDSYMGLKLFLEDLFLRNVDVVTYDALRPPLRRAIIAEAVNVTA